MILTRFQPPGGNKLGHYLGMFLNDGNSTCLCFIVDICNYLLFNKDTIVRVYYVDFVEVTELKSSAEQGVWRRMAADYLS